MARALENLGMNMPVPGLPSTPPAAPAREVALSARPKRGPSTWGFRLVMLYLLLEFARPQELTWVIAVLRLPAVTTLLLVATLLSSRKLLPVLRETRAFQMLLILMGLHVPIATNNYWALWTTVTMLQTFVIYLGILTFVDTEERLRAAARMWVGIHAFLALQTFRNGGQGIGGFLGDENDVAMALDMVVPVAFFLAFNRSSRIHDRSLMTGILLLVIVALPLTMSRGGLVGLVAVVLYCAIRSPRKVMTGAVVVAMGLLLILASPQGYWTRMETILWDAPEDDSGAGRIYEWKIGWKMFAGSPLIGVGPGNFSYRFAEYEGDMRWNTRSLAGRAAHSFYLTLLPELGVVGLVLVATMVIGACRGMAQVRRLARREGTASRARSGSFPTALSLALEGSLLGFLVTSAFISPLYYPNLWVLLGFMEALRRCAVVRRSDGRWPQPSGVAGRVELPGRGRLSPAQPALRDYPHLMRARDQGARLRGN